MSVSNFSYFHTIQSILKRCVALIHFFIPYTNFHTIQSILKQRNTSYNPGYLYLDFHTIQSILKQAEGDSVLWRRESISILFSLF